LCLRVLQLAPTAERILCRIENNPSASEETFQEA
jgi:hypothetical protein